MQKNMSELLEASIAPSAYDNLHALDTMSQEGVATPKEEVVLPESYGDDRLVLMPVNANWSYLYWDLSKRRLKEAGLQPDQGFTGIIHIVDADKLRIETSIAFSYWSGWHYVNIHAPWERVYAVLGFVDGDGHFVELLRSRTTTLPSDELAQESGEELWVGKHESWMQIIRASVSGVNPLTSTVFANDEEWRTLMQEEQRRRAYFSAMLLEGLKR
ncbi:MAG: DUF4912 domain-containing protein [Campylobacterales bacterium]